MSNEASSTSMETQFLALPPSWVRVPIYIGAGFFILALILSAVFDPRIRVLHTLQALIYVIIILLVKRSNPWGYGAGFFIAVFWNYTNLFITTFVKAGWIQIMGLVHTGHLPRPDRAVAVLAAGGHFLMIGACFAGFLLLSPKLRDWLRFLTGGAAAIACFVLIIYTTGPQYIPLIRRVFHL